MLFLIAINENFTIFYVCKYESVAAYIISDSHDTYNFIKKMLNNM